MSYFKLKDSYSEGLIRDLILFFLLFFLVVAQDWDNILLLLFPLTTFGFAVFFKIIDNIKKKSELEIVYNPLGSEKINFSRLIFCSLLQMILLFWYGAESLYHPQLVDNYYIYFIIIFIFLYTFGFFWIFLDIWRYSRIQVLTEGFELNEILKISNKFDNVVSFLKMKSFKIISLVNLLVFIILNILNIVFGGLIFLDIIPGMEHNLPGTRIENSEPIQISVFIYGIFFISPSVSVIFLLMIRRDINNINRNKLNNVLKDLPEDVKMRIIENLKAMNKKLNNKL